MRIAASEKARTGIAVCDRVLDYYHTLPVQPDICMPLKSAFDPMALKDVLPNIFISEWEAPDRLKVRLRGTAIEEKTGRVPRDTNVLECMHKYDRLVLIAAVRDMLAMPCGSLMERGLSKGTSRLRMMNLALPMADNDGVPRFLVGVSLVEGTVLMPNERDPTGPLLTEARIKLLRFVDLGYGVPPPRAYDYNRDRALV